jgi:hypothetical protein
LRDRGQMPPRGNSEGGSGEQKRRSSHNGSPDPVPARP